MDSLSTTPQDTDIAAPSARQPGPETSRNLRLAMAVLWTLVILGLCWMPGTWLPRAEEDSFWEIPDLDKVVHWGIFFVFAVLWLRTARSPRTYAWVAAGGVTIAVVTEVVQQLPAIGRDGEVADAITDLIGIAIGLVLFRWVTPLLDRLESMLLRLFRR